MSIDVTLIMGQLLALDLLIFLQPLLVYASMKDTKHHSQIAD